MVNKQREKMTEIKEILISNSKKFQQYADSFQRVFGVGLKKYWINHVLGFDIIKFDKEVIKSGARSMAEVVKKKYGKEGLDLINVLIN
jgi:hypothetical protein